MTGTLIAWVFWGVLLPWLVLRVWAEDRQAKRDLASQVRFSEARKRLADRPAVYIPSAHVRGPMPPLPRKQGVVR